ncbi:hypothetical protein F5B21DRAFT_524319 [Xylaria acuta]|nr:hypothetical protein F5B21DRAFT_524319 [Xylaria acuta]
MFDFSATVFPPDFDGVVCFEKTLGCLEVRSCPSTPESQPETSRPPYRALCADISLLWGLKRPLTVSFLDSRSTLSFTDEQVKDFVKDGAQEWTHGTSLYFKFLDIDDPDRDRADIRISFQGIGNYSVVGTTFVEFGKPTMNLGFEPKV